MQTLESYQILGHHVAELRKGNFAVSVLVYLGNDLFHLPVINRTPA